MSVLFRLILDDHDSVIKVRNNDLRGGGHDDYAYDVLWKPVTFDFSVFLDDTSQNARNHRSADDLTRIKWINLTFDRASSGLRNGDFSHT